jgi:hypothetical protein
MIVTMPSSSIGKTWAARMCCTASHQGARTELVRRRHQQEVNSPTQRSQRALHRRLLLLATILGPVEGVAQYRRTPHQRPMESTAPPPLASLTASRTRTKRRTPFQIRSLCRPGGGARFPKAEPKMSAHRCNRCRTRRSLGRAATTSALLLRREVSLASAEFHPSPSTRAMTRTGSC